VKKCSYILIVVLVLGLHLADAQNITWQSVGLDPFSVVDFCKTKNNIQFAVVSNGIFKVSTDNGVNWVTKTLDVDSLNINYHVTADSSNNLYFAEYGGVYKSTDLGGHWFKISNGFTGYPTPEIYAIKILPNQNIVVGTLAGTRVSTNGGASWTATTNPGAFNVFDMCNNVLFEGGSGLAGMGVRKSTDFGLTWIQTNYTYDVGGMCSVNSKLLVSGGLISSHFAISSDLGTTWDSVFYAPCPNSALIKKDINNNLWSYFYYSLNSSNNGLYYSKDEGNSWTKTAFPYVVNSLYIDNSNYLYLSTTSGLFKIDASVLPVELTSFTAAIKNGKPYLEWKTATEINNRGFEIQRSYDNNIWNSVGFIKGAGTTSDPQIYSFADAVQNQSGSAYYRLRQVDFDGTSKISPVVEVKLNKSLTFCLMQNYPNPFNPSTTIEYNVPNDSHISLKVYDILGKEVMTLVNESKNAGSYSLKVNCSSLNSGVYFYTMKAGSYNQTKKFILMK